MDDDPLSRQRRLAEIGETGQARIAAHPAQVCAQAGADVELAYLCRAGVEQLEISSRAQAPACPHRAEFHHAASRSVGEGAWRALRQLREALGMVNA